MNLHLFVPGLFWPDNLRPEIYHELQLPALEAILAKSQYTENMQQTLESWLCQAFGVEKQQDWPIAPIQLQLDGKNIEAGNNYWLRVDPVHLRIENNHALLADSQLLSISLKEATLLADDINRQFEADGLVLLPLCSDRWYLRCNGLPDLRTFLLSQASGRNINDLLPTGRDSAIWNSRINEIQMLLYDHPLNRVREENGELTINSLWMWGGGVRPQKVHTRYTEIWSNHVLAQALAKMGEGDCRDLPENAEELLKYSAGSGEYLVVLDSLQKHACYRDAYRWRDELMKLEMNWFTILFHALRKKQIARLTLTVANTRSAGDFVITPNSLWKFWVTARPLKTYC